MIKTPLNIINTFFPINMRKMRNKRLLSYPVYYGIIAIGSFRGDDSGHEMLLSDWLTQYSPLIGGHSSSCRSLIG